MSNNDNCSLLTNDALQQPQQAFGSNFYQQPTSIYSQTATLPYFTNPQQTIPYAPGVAVISQPQSRMMSTTTVVTNQPMKRKWMTGLSDCCANCSVCVGVYFCGLCYECAVAKKMGESGCLAVFPGGVAGIRTQYRTRHQIAGTMLDDMCVSCCCRPCVLCQMMNDMNALGYPKTCCCI